MLGDPAEQLIRTAGRESLLVIGASRGGRVSGKGPIPVAVVARREGPTAVIPVGTRAGKGGVVVLVRGSSDTFDTASLAALTARDRGEPLTVVRLQDPAEIVNGLSMDLRVDAPLDHDRGGLVALDPRSIRDSIRLLSSFDAASLLVLQGRPSPGAIPGFNLERWLARSARAPFIVVGPPRPSLRPSPADRAGESAAAR